VIFDKDTEYSRVWIVEGREIVTKNSIRSLRMSKQNASSMYMDNNELVYPYTRFYHIARHFFPDFKRTLMLGGAGYSFPKNFLESYPAAKMDVIEIDPGITKIAQDYFRLESSHRLSIFHEDARVYLNRDHERYDVIY
jgi:spermidine synthase